MITKAQRIANLLRAVSGSDKRIQPTSAVIVAAGSSSRMGEVGGVKKQHIELCGIPVVVRSMMAFESCELIREIVVVAREDEMSLYDEYRGKYSITKLSHVVAGGNTRQESVLNGFEAIDPQAKFVAIHDGARCLVTEQMIESVCLAAYRNRAATAATAVRDTVKLTDRHGFIDSTVDRNLVWLAQTPQVFYTPLYRAAAYSAREEGFEATDDNSLVERIQNPVKLVECGRENIKLTTPDDIALAEQILATRESKSEGTT
ncbi:MAG: 2-C-methyl-D-erythritol 4-phosphate cytidylyltransferase [Clostridia bacterium]|nr:2-C-methyl-D-erythritol 4-phosphate cytidylyltransferase [Clostridia bacterium]